MGCVVGACMPPGVGRDMSVRMMAAAVIDPMMSMTMMKSFQRKGSDWVGITIKRPSTSWANLTLVGVWLSGSLWLSGVLAGHAHRQFALIYEGT